jgi:hypothetical protein
VTALAEKQQYSADDYIPSAVWGKDHWTTLAYVETVATDCAGFQVGSDARMRTNRRHFRVMQDCLKPRRAKAGGIGLVMDPVAHATRLNDGQTVEGHDDWNCVQDLANEGLFNLDASGVEPGITLHLSTKGQAWCAKLRSHKQAGGTYSTVNIADMPQVESPAPKELEVFSFMGQAFNVSGMLEDLTAARIKPAKAQFEREFIENFATTVQGLKKDAPHATGMSILTGVRAVDVHAIPDSAYDMPLILAYAGKNKGTLNIDGTGAHYLLVDGNKRLGKAFFTGREKLDVVVLNQAQTRKYKM